MNTLSPLLLAMKNFDPEGLRCAVSTGQYSRNEVSGALVWLAEQGFLEGVQTLLPHANVKLNNSLALRNAARAGHAHVVECLIPLSSVSINHSQAMRAAAKHLHAEVVALLLPHATVEDATLAIRDTIQKLAYCVQWEPDLARSYLDVARTLLPRIDMRTLLEWCNTRQHTEPHLELIDYACLDWNNEAGGVVEWMEDADMLKRYLPRAFVAWEHARLSQSTPTVFASPALQRF